ncbi:MAG: undecaprenyldiphospho-muramoylpentapeptide beta-N-acetylglucosaminyltransferase [Gemmatimonadetes bacterium]|nr:undecaprenyldiphospho-muramoylpentapeptide beta-N-acetylglucosaminyltransferase [Gemmatimonadota bacterium]
MTKRAPRVLFAGGGTGGHLYPALALAAAFQERDPATEVFFIGARRGIESRVLPERGVPHVLLPLEPIRRSRPWENWRLVPALARTGMGLRRAFSAFKPDLVIGTGGYASGPVVGWAILTGIPTALQEQNSYPGFTTRLLAGRARQIHLAFPEARQYLKPGKATQVFEHGNPIRPPDPSADRAQARRKFKLGDGTVALVVGGSQGSRALNEALLADFRAVAASRLSAPPAGMEILWATGPSHYDGIIGRLGELGLGDWVHAVPYIEDMPSALASADLAVSRAGAMASAELCAWGIPSILVPLPTAAANHQHFNALALSEAGAAVMVPEAELGSGRLWSELTALVGDRTRRELVASRALERGHPHAAAEIVASLAELL